MRLSSWLSSASCFIFTSSLVVTVRQDILAEQQFKNIQVLKGKKASEVIPAMQFIDASLKVDCDYCHVEDRSSDEKGPKKAAREMILMQNEINEKNFGGRLQVTCATCHAGHTHPIGLPPVTGVETRPRRTTDITVAQILDQYTKAEGVGATQHPFSSVVLTGLWGAKSDKKSVTVVISGNKFHVDTDAKTRFQHVGYNGTALWFGTPNGPFTVPSQYAATFLNQESIILGPASMPQLTNPTAGTATVEGRETQVVSGAIEGTPNRAAIYFDKLTGLPARVVYTYPTVLGNVAQINDYSDYKKVNGVPLPTMVAHHSAEGDAVLHFTSIKVNTKVDTAIFEPKK